MSYDIDIKELRQRAESAINLFLEVDGSGKGYVCPKCRSGSGENGTGLSTKDGHHYHCWRCDFHGDIIELMGQMNTNSNDPKEITMAGAKYIRETLGIKPQAKNTHYTQNVYDTHNTVNTHNQEKDPIKEKAAQQAIKKTIKEAEKHLSETEYLIKRGISEKTAKRFHIGYIANWTHPDIPNAPASPRIIIPTSEFSYTARDTRNNLTETQKRFSKQKAGQVHIFNLDALFDYTKPCFITEGEIDALSIIEMGYNACALGSTSNIRKLAEAIQGRTCAYPIIYLDSDEPGKQADIKLQTTLVALGKAYTTITGKHEADKDPNDFLVRSKDDFKNYLAEAQAEAEKALSDEKNEYMSDNCAASYVDDFLTEIDNRAKTPCTPTGFDHLDRALDGGLYEGLYILGAISSLGKTTFILQMADQIAKNGRDVLFYSLEQSRHELIGKSLSRETALISEQWGVNKAKKYRDITNAERHKSFKPDDFEIMAQAISEYKERAQHLYIIEGVGDIGVKDIRAKVEEHIRKTGQRPIVFIDYLQIILAPDDKNRSDKQVADMNITDLKRLSRDLKLTIFGISSFNRDNYTASVNMAAFKESGAIEYSSDVLIGLQFADIKYAQDKDSKNGKSVNEQINEAKKQNPRQVELVILKNRNGALGNTNFEYYPEYNRYKEIIKNPMW